MLLWGYSPKVLLLCLLTSSTQALSEAEAEGAEGGEGGGGGATGLPGIGRERGLIRARGKRMQALGKLQYKPLGLQSKTKEFGQVITAASGPWLACLLCVSLDLIISLMLS